MDWPEILNQHGGIVWKTIRRLVTDDADASDCFQETFVAAWEYSRKQPVINWPGFLTRLATARSLDFLRKRLRTKVVSLVTEGTGEPACQHISPAATAEENELVRRLRDALAEMPHDQAEVCCLRFIENFSYEQIADALRIPVNHVGVLLHRAKTSLRHELATFAPLNQQRTEV